MGRMRRTGSEVHEEGLVGADQRLLLAYPVDSVVGQVLGQVITFFGRSRRRDGSGSFVQLGLVLVTFAADEAVEIFESAAARGPLIERSCGTRLPHRHLMTLAEL